jgi:hypothetical protein
MQDFFRRRREQKQQLRQAEAKTEEVGNQPDKHK